MDKYYRHFRNRRIYRVLHIATIEADPKRKAVVYQAMYEDGAIWVRPYENFFETVYAEGKSIPRFREVTEEEALEEIPLYLWPKYHFPDLDYTEEIPLLVNPGKFSSSVIAMIHLMVNSRLVNKSLFEGLPDDDAIEKEALSRIKAFKDGEDPEPIFHLIQAWGGMGGRGLYVHEGAWKKEEIMGAYNELITACEKTREVNNESMKTLSKAVVEFDKKVKHLGIAFITKHTRFWLYRTLGEDALPIYDSVMAKTVMGIPTPEARSLCEYWEVMHSKAQHLGISLMALERQIFAYAFPVR